MQITNYNESAQDLGLFAAEKGLDFPNLNLQDGFGQYCQNPELFTCRGRLLSYLIKLSKALDERAWDLADSLVRLFGRTLADYLAVGHWQAFHSGILTQQNEPVPGSDKLAALAASTRQAMYFSDKFCRGNPALDAVRPALEDLALALDARFEIEDELFPIAA